MATHREASLEHRVAHRAAQYGIPSVKLGHEGWPDRIFWLPGGIPLLIEYKRPDEKPTDLQLRRHAVLRQLGYLVEVHDNAIRSWQRILDVYDAMHYAWWRDD